MDKITCILVDDEKSARNVLSNLLENNFPEFTIEATCKNVLEAVEQIKKKKPQVVFLDVQMPNYAGYELVKFFDEIDFEIIFVTAFDNYAIKAFELSAVDYLVKPVSRLRLTESVHKLKNKLSRTYRTQDYYNLLESIKEEEFSTLILPELGSKRVVKLADIVAIEADGAYTHFYLVNNLTHTVSKNLAHFDNTLSDSNRFFRSHRKWIINVDTVKEYDKKNHRITHQSGLITDISRRKAVEFDTLFVPQ